MNTVILDQKPAISHLLTKLRDKNTPAPDFRNTLETLSLLVIGEALEKAPSEKATVETPVGNAEVRRIIENKVVGAPILRAALGMVRPFMKLLPAASISYVGFKRDEKTLEPDYYYDSLPDNLIGKTVFVLDPMLATGGSAVAAAKLIDKRSPDKIVFCAIIAASEGVSRLDEAFPDIPIYIAAIDKHLNENGYIIPGLGDAGDRLFGT